MLRRDGAEQQAVALAGKGLFRRHLRPVQQFIIRNRPFRNLPIVIPVVGHVQRLVVVRKATAQTLSIDLDDGDSLGKMPPDLFGYETPVGKGRFPQDRAGDGKLGSAGVHGHKLRAQHGGEPPAVVLRCKEVVDRVAGISTDGVGPDVPVTGMVSASLRIHFVHVHDPGLRKHLPHPPVAKLSVDRIGGQGADQHRQLVYEGDAEVNQILVSGVGREEPAQNGPASHRVSVANRAFEGKSKCNMLVRMSSSYVIGFDLGGTKMLAAVIDQEGTIVATKKEQTPPGGDAKAVYASVVNTIQEAAKKADTKIDSLAGVGIAVPSPVDFKRGVVLSTPNLGLSDFPLRDRLSEDLGIPVVVENDVNAGTFGEYVGGAAKGFTDVVGIFPGTGVGGGLILDGRLYRGATGGAGEVGHMIVQTDGRLCGCGQHGCLEAVASKTAIAKDLVMLADTGSAPTVLELAGTSVAAIKSSVILKAIEAGEAEAIRVVHRAAEFLGIGMANLVNIFNPQLIVVGGGLVEKLGHDHYLGIAEASMRAHAMPRLSEVVEVREAQLGDDAALMGVAALMRTDRS